MSTQTMAEKESFVAAFDREYQTTLKVLRAYPADKAELKPSEKMKNARELAWMLVLNQMVVVAVLAGDLRPGAFPGPPATWNEMLAAFEREHQATMSKLQDLDDQELQRTLPMPTGPGKMGEMRKGEALWFFLNDTIHHRGQLTVYLRLAGGKVPSIYGPTADERWS